ncbi:MAG: alpha/beta hydrolase [Prolixibacteraceae bacterium]|nr:alpha/beta hydrolase [Prolixibacteraceae bacterium]
MKKFKRYLIILLLILTAAYLLGPKPPKPDLNKNLPSLPASIGNVESYVREQEKETDVRTDNESRIVWADDSNHVRTEYCLLYLHGFSASWYEGYPVNINFARYFGCNAYLPRLASHGENRVDALIDMTPGRLWESAKESLMLARSLGKNVIIMGASTGGTLGLKLAADFPEYVDGLILLSPNIRIKNNSSFLLSRPWGLQIARSVYDGRYRITNQDTLSKECQYWYCKYRLESIVYLQQLIDATMTSETFSSISVPVFLGYYYKDRDNQDDVVKVSAMLKMFEKLETPEGEKVKVAFPEAGSHVIASELFSGSVDDVLKETLKFGREVLNMKPAD